MNHPTTTSRWTTLVRDELKARRAARASLRSLERDPAHHTTPSEISEIRAVVSRYDGPDAERVLHVLNRSRVA